MHVRSLIRLLIGAALLCLAWMVLTSGQASAAERSGPSDPRFDVARALPLVGSERLEEVLGGVLGTSPGLGGEPERHTTNQTTRHTPVKAKAAEKRSGAKKSTRSSSAVTTSAGSPATTVAPVIDLVGNTARSTLDTGLDTVTEVVALPGSVPVLGETVGQVTDVVMTVLRTLPEAVTAVPDVPRPIGDGTPSEVLPPAGPTHEVAAARDPLTAEAAGAHDSPVRVSTTDVALTPTRHELSDRAGAVTVPTGRGPGVPADLGTPLDSSPALPSQPTPTGGAAPGAGDPATASATVVLPAPSLFGRSSADWRVPRGLPAQPGTRPD